MVLALDNPDLSGRPRLSLGSLRLTAEAPKYLSKMRLLDMPDVI
jgi:hypothetical protein